MNMYIAQATNGSFKVVKNLGVIDPKERVHGVREADKHSCNLNWK
jgi:hypothetical protein